MLKNKKIRICNAIIIFLMCFCLLGNGIVAQANVPRKRVEISKTSSTMYSNMTNQIKIVNASSGVQWSSSNDKIVSILGSKGRHKETVTIKSKNRTGACRIRAKVKGKIYTCKITVKKDTNVSRAKLIKVSKTSQKISIKVKLYNRTKKDMEYGNSYRVEKFINGAWKKVAPKNNAVFDSIAISIPANSSKTEVYTIARKSEVKQFTKGTYRLKVDAYTKEANNYVIFSLY